MEKLLAMVGLLAFAVLIAANPVRHKVAAPRVGGPFGDENTWISLNRTGDYQIAYQNQHPEVKFTLFHDQKNTSLLLQTMNISEVDAAGSPVFTVVIGQLTRQGNVSIYSNVDKIVVDFNASVPEKKAIIEWKWVYSTKNITHQVENTTAVIVDHGLEYVVKVAGWTFANATNKLQIIQRISPEAGKLSHQGSTTTSVDKRKKFSSTCQDFDVISNQTSSAQLCYFNFGGLDSRAKAVTVKFQNNSQVVFTVPTFNGTATVFGQIFLDPIEPTHEDIIGVWIALTIVGVATIAGAVMTFYHCVIKRFTQPADPYAQVSTVN